MKPMPPEQFKKFALKRMPSRENLERLRAVGILREMQGDDFGRIMQDLAENLLDIKQQGTGGRKNVNGSPRHWKAE